MSSRSTITTGGGAVQGSFDELGTPLREATFVVLDLETTGTSPTQARITEVGAVKVRGGEVLGEFQTFVDPGGPIPAFITVLTGITDAMVLGAPKIGAVLASFLEFAKGAVLVAHNAPFDIGFLRAACAATGRAWPAAQVLDTAALARRTLHRDEAPNCKLATLARLFRAGTTPDHRALHDARATVDVLHGLLERLGGLGVESVEELLTFSARVSVAQRRKRHLAEPLPNAPGVYLFLDARDRPLYIGKSRDVRTRVRTYFTASEMRTRMAEMVALAERVQAIVCATPLEAEVRELRLIAEHKPRYNRRSRFPERALWVKVTVEPLPRLSLVRQVAADDAAYLGPFPSTRLAEQAMAALYEAYPIRQCKGRLSPRGLGTACALAEIGRCGAPCDGRESVAAYDTHVRGVRAAMRSDARRLVAAARRRIEALAETQRYEEAAAARDRLAAFVRTAARMQRVEALSSCAELVAAAPDQGGWELAVVRHGRLAGASRVPAGAAVGPYLSALTASAETVLPGPGPLPAASAEESELILRWLDRPGARLVSLSDPWCSPLHGAERYRALLDAANRARLAAEPDAPRRWSRPVGPVLA
jgi:DNA polymerase-3 subunit epsilon